MAAIKNTSVENAARILAIQRCGNIANKKATSPVEVISVRVRADFTLALVNYNTKNVVSESTLQEEKEKLKKQAQAAAEKPGTATPLQPTVY